MLLQAPEGSDGSTPSSEILDGAADFVLEVGTEELPPADVTSAVAQLQGRMESLLADLSLTNSGVNVQGTPRRLVVQVAQLAAMQEVSSEERRGPPRKRAYDDAGAPTKALVGFCKSSGADVDSVFFQADKKVRCQAVIGMWLQLFHLNAKNWTQTFRISLSVSDTVVIAGARGSRVDGELPIIDSDDFRGLA